MISVIIPSKLEPNILRFMEDIERLSPSQIIVCNDRYGMGKGWALREALKEAKYNKVIFIDGDGDIQPDEIKKILKLLVWCDVVVGKKDLPKRLDRKLLTFLSRLWIRLLFGLTMDTQTGIKGFNYHPKWKNNLWAFDIEILYNAKKQGKIIAEIPIKAIVSDSKSSKDILATLRDTIKIRFSC